MDLIPEVLIPLLIIGAIVYLFTRQNRERAENAPLRGEIEARVCFETTLQRASILGTGGFGGTRGMWISLRGPKRLIVGTDAFMVSAPQALREFVFRGSESSIAFGQAVNPDDYIRITGRAGGRQVQLAITGRNLPDIWQALAGTGAALMLRVVNSESSSGTCRKSVNMEYLVFPMPASWTIQSRGRWPRAPAVSESAVLIYGKTSAAGSPLVPHDPATRPAHKRETGMRLSGAEPGVALASAVHALPEGRAAPGRPADVKAGIDLAQWAALPNDSPAGKRST